MCSSESRCCVSQIIRRNMNYKPPFKNHGCKTLNKTSQFWFVLQCLDKFNKKREAFNSSKIKKKKYVWKDAGCNFWCFGEQKYKLRQKKKFKNDHPSPQQQQWGSCTVSGDTRGNESIALNRETKGTSKVQKIREQRATTVRRKEMWRSEKLEMETVEEETQKSDHRKPVPHSQAEK